LAIFREHGEFRNFEARLYRKDRSVAWFRYSGRIYPEKGYIEGVAADITEEKRLKEQLLQAQKMEAIGTLAGGIAHNFNNLLTGVVGNASLLLMDIDSEHPHYENLKNIEKQVKNGSKLTAQLIGFARKGQYEVKPISLNQVVKETSDTFDITRKEIVVHQELDAKLYGIKADQGQLEQTLLNLCVNAADAMPGGGNLFLKTQNVTHKDMTGKPFDPKPGNYTLLTIRDDGAGMDKETMERIFEPFFTTKGLAEGTGLGLASAYGIIKGHGGYIDVDSEKGHGTTFSIYLPSLEEAVKNKKGLPGEIVKGKGSVLLVDDEEMVLNIGEQILEKLGYEVLSAMGGIEALELYEKNQDKIDMVLLDMVMPGMGGGKTYDKMREINSHIKVLLASGYSIEGEAEEILERGCDGFIPKPFSIEELSNKMREILDKD
jgi:signal transduction histidine kinase